MKNYVLFTFGLLFSLNTFAQSEKKMYVLSGSIAGKYNIQMTITIEDNQVLGHYFYDNYGIYIPLTGIVDGTKITLSESSEPGTDLKIGFIGYLNNGEFKGNWMDFSKRKNFPFSLSVYGETSVTASKAQLKIAGNYENKTLKKYDFGNIRLQHIYENVYLIEITTGTPEGCTGYLKNILFLTEDKKASYNVPNCNYLQFTFSSKTIQITEESCDLHGMDCSFNGKYTKK